MGTSRSTSDCGRQTIKHLPSSNSITSSSVGRIFCDSPRTSNEICDFRISWQNTQKLLLNDTDMGWEPLDPFLGPDDQTHKLCPSGAARLQSCANKSPCISQQISVMVDAIKIIAIKCCKSAGHLITWRHTKKGE